MGNAEGLGVRTNVVLIWSDDWGETANVSVRTYEGGVELRRGGPLRTRGFY